jgi:hypothetical protein
MTGGKPKREIGFPEIKHRYGYPASRPHKERNHWGTTDQPRFKSIFIKRMWGIPSRDIEVMREFPVGDLLRPGGWMVLGVRPCEVAEAIRMMEKWGLKFGTLAFRRHTPYKKTSKAWAVVKNHILREDLQEVVVIGWKPPYNGKGLQYFATRPRPFLTNYPTRWEYDQYWKISVLFGYPRLEIWGRPNEGYGPRFAKWTRIGPHIDGMPIEQSLWLQHAQRSPTPLDSSWLSRFSGASS